MSLFGVGELGLPLREYGEVIQSLARVLVDRGHPLEVVVTRLIMAIDEMQWWEEVGGPVVDGLAIRLGLDPFPAEDARG